MAQFLAEVERSFLRDDKEVLELRIPSVSEGAARRKAAANARIKDMEEPEIVDVENIGGSGVPGRPLWIVTIEGLR